jgi:hypothetical protein
MYRYPCSHHDYLSISLLAPRLSIDILAPPPLISYLSISFLFLLLCIDILTTDGNAPIDTRNDFVTGLNGGLALPLYMLTYLRDFGIKNQTAFSSLQYSYRMDNDEYACGARCVISKQQGANGPLGSA